MRFAAAKLPVPLPGLFYLTDPDRTPDPSRTARYLPQGSGIIYRHFGAADRSQTAVSLAKIAARRGLILLIAADPKLALHVGAHGVHWPEANRREARRWITAFALQTVSAHSPAALRKAARFGFDAAFVSTVFPSNSQSAGKAMGPVRFRRLAQASPIPVYALGGVDAGSGARLSHAGGLAAIGGIESVFGETRLGEFEN